MLSARDILRRPWPRQPAPGKSPSRSISCHPIPFRTTSCHPISFRPISSHPTHRSIPIREAASTKRRAPVSLVPFQTAARFFWGCHSVLLCSFRPLALWDGRVVVIPCLRCSNSIFWRNSSTILIEFW